jgi:hypothetical protein
VAELKENLDKLEALAEFQGVRLIKFLYIFPSMQV